jgi:hypothetical protein
MASQPETPFDTIEGAHEFVGLLAEAVEEARGALAEEIARAQGEGALRRLEGLQLVTYKLDRLQQHVSASRHLLNDLRTLRRLLLGERKDVLKTVLAEPPDEEKG